MLDPWEICAKHDNVPVSVSSVSKSRTDSCGLAGQFS